MKDIHHNTWIARADLGGGGAGVRFPPFQSGGSRGHGGGGGLDVVVRNVFCQYSYTI